MRYRPQVPFLPLSLFLLGVFFVQSALAEQRVAVYGKWMTPAEAAEFRGKAATAVASPAWGTASTSLLALGPCDATLRSPSNTYTATNCELLTPVLPGPTLASVGFPVHLATGVLITEITVNYFDSHTSDDPSMGLWETDTTGLQTPIVGLSPDPFSGGNNSQTFVVDPPYQVNNANTLAVLALLNAADGVEYVGVYSVVVRYQLQVSPAPGTATFNDVPTNHPFFQFVEALAASGITAGCGGGNFCPDNPLTRGQMAVFLSIALGLHFPN